MALDLNDDSSARKDLRSLQASPQEQLPTASVSVRELFNERKRFETFPAFQRKQCWGLKQEQAWIDTLLLGDPAPPLEGYQEFDADGQSLWRMVDGHQRISATLRFLDGEFKTWTLGQKKQSEPNSEPPVEPGRFFRELSVIARNYLLDYRININKIRHKSNNQLATRFLRIQNHMPLSAAEKLNVYLSKATNAARKIEHHEFWSDLYEGKTSREQVLQSSLYLLALEMSPTGMQDLQSWAYIHNLAAGKHDAVITEELVERVIERLDVVCTVYKGVSFTVRATIVPMYQSVKFLEQSGYDFRSSDKGKLAKWIKALIAESLRSSSATNFHIPIQKMLRESAQRAFWDTNLKTVMALLGVSQESLPHISLLTEK